jgi:hypothetical protein
MRLRSLLLVILGFGVVTPSAHAQIQQVWLTHRSNDPSKIVINWKSKTPGDSRVRFGPTSKYGQTIQAEDDSKLHHLEVPRPLNADLHYSVSTGEHHSADTVIKAYDPNVLRVAVVADWQGKPGLQALVKDDVHLILTAGDNIPELWSKCGVGVKDCTQPYELLIDAYPDLFGTVPIMPALGNHDREIRQRGDKPPAEPVYDVDATAFRNFFALPGDQWKWHFDVPDFDVRFVALDLNHIQDRGTTWQTCHDFRKGSPQYKWYDDLMKSKSPGFVVTLQNERNATMRSQEKGAWHQMFRRGSLVISGFGYFAERAVADGLTYLNTSLGKGTPYPDPNSKFLANEGSYVLLTFEKGKPTATAELKSLDGKVLDRTEIAKRSEKK